MGKAITNRVKGKVWTDTMIMEFDGNIAGGVETCFRALNVEQMDSMLNKLKEIRDARIEHAQKKEG